MRLRILPAVLLLAACSPSPDEPTAAPALSFSAAGGAWVWRVADEPTAALILARETTGADSEPALVISCDSQGAGGLQTRVFRAEPAPTPLVLTAGQAVLTVPGRRGPIGDQPVLQGEGALPPGWATALGAAPVLKLRYGDQGIEVQGPGPARAAEFGRRCRDLEPPRR